LQSTFVRRVIGKMLILTLSALVKARPRQQLRLMMLNDATLHVMAGLCPGHPRLLRGFQDVDARDHARA
jgi:hypothetical protein